MAEEVVSLCASGGHHGVTPAPPHPHQHPHFLQGYTARRWLNYISKVAVVRGVRSQRRHRGKASEWRFKKKKKTAFARYKKREKWILDSRVKCRKAKKKCQDKLNVDYYMAAMWGSQGRLLLTGTAED